MASATNDPDAAAGVGGALAPKRSELGMAQRAGIIARKASNPLLTAEDLAREHNCSPSAVRGLLATMILDLQPILRTYTIDLGEAAVDAALMAAKDGKGQQAQELLMIAGAVPDRAKSGTGLNVTVIVSAPPGTPQYDATLAPPPLVLDVQAGPQAPLTPLLPPPLGDA
jgi:hypothetical protein